MYFNFFCQPLILLPAFYRRHCLMSALLLENIAAVPLPVWFCRTGVRIFCKRQAFQRNSFLRSTNLPEYIARDDLNKL